MVNCVSVSYEAWLNSSSYVNKQSSRVCNFMRPRICDAALYILSLGLCALLYVATWLDLYYSRTC